MNPGIKSHTYLRIGNIFFYSTQIEIYKDIRDIYGQINFTTSFGGNQVKVPTKLLEFEIYKK